MLGLYRLYRNLPAPVPNTGKAVTLSPSRRLVCDLLYFAKQIPTVPVQRKLDLSLVVQARGACLHRPRWVAIFTKAYALLAAERPELRQSFLKYPWARLWQHSCSVASVAVSRHHEEEEAVFFAKIREPEAMELTELDAILDRHVNSPVEEIEAYRLAIASANLPSFLRRWIWWAGLNWRGIWREAIFGTFGVSVYSGTGAESLHPISPLTTLLNYGPIDENGCVDVRIVYDHRVMDGKPVAEALARLQEIFDEQITTELRRLPSTALRIAA